MFHKVLIANRGEIACRIIRTLKRMGVITVAIYSEADIDALHKTSADIALPLGGFAAVDSYLKGDLILQLALDAGIDAIIPGYGFLSENFEFVDSCERAGVIFIGPTSEHIRNFGLKHLARHLSEQVGIPCTSGTGILSSATEAGDMSTTIGYPVILKNTAGGGGIGLAVCTSREEVIASYDGVQRIGEQQFSNGGVFLEQFIEVGRHVEVQIFGDGKGNIAVLGDRDCSIQRRNQKIIEECPAPNLSDSTRDKMHTCARKLGESVCYRSAGTVEFIYDLKSDKFYFLEVNTRIQVEHTVTEMCTGLDIIECMVKLAYDTEFSIHFMNKIPEGVSIEVRLNAEDPLRGFKPSPGVLKEVYFPICDEGVRIDTGVETSSEVSVFYDSLIAKVIVWAETRDKALKKMHSVLIETSLLGINHNLSYVTDIISSDNFMHMNLSTKFLDTFHFVPAVIEVIEGGAYTTVQDFPGRIGYWAEGVPPSGPMDDFSFRLANRLVGNDVTAAGLECTVVGPTLFFHQDSIVAIVGGKVNADISGSIFPMNAPVLVQAGQTLTMGKVVNGVRCYLAVFGGISTQTYLGSRSTFVLGKFAGLHGDGSVIKAGDMLPVPKMAGTLSTAGLPSLSPYFTSTSFPSLVEVGVLYGPHGAPDFFQTDSMTQFFSTDYEVHYNASRLGVRLVGPKPSWARANGGEAGLHPSNIHDTEYTVGSINFTGDFPVILTCDGPSLGGFVCPVVIAKAELWKIGQVKPGDLIRFVPISFQTAVELENELLDTINSLSNMRNPSTLKPLDNIGVCILKSLPANDDHPLVLYRQAGDSNILLEYGEMELDLALRVRVHCLMEAVAALKVDGLIEMSPGVRSLQFQFDFMRLPPQKLIEILTVIEDSLPNAHAVSVPSRIVQMPMAFEDSATLEAVERYRQTVRKTAPWLPNNVDFMQRINGLVSRQEVSAALFEASYLVLGLGDVYLGAPCAVPLDPRHRLVTSKYNPARTHTAEGTVGIGGVYMCIYGMDSPGGYQLVGRTIPIWSRDRLVVEPWLLKPFDQVSFYQVSEEELCKMRKLKDKSRVLKICPTSFSLIEYDAFLNTNHESIEAFKAKQKGAFDEEVKLWEGDTATSGEADDEFCADRNVADDCLQVLATSHCCVWKLLVKTGDAVAAGEDLLILEAMKMEIRVSCPVDGVVVSVMCVSGKMVKTGDVLLVIRPVEIISTVKPLTEWILKFPEPVVEGAGSLTGLSFAVKDNINVKGVLTTAACPEFSFIPAESATVIKSLLAQGAELRGKTNLDQFACGLNGTRSPYGSVPNSFNADYVSGGSSSGSAVTVATGQVHFSLGTDTAGSGRVPAMLNNIVGLKPSKGLISTKGVIPAAASADCVSIFARTVEVAWQVLMVAKGYDAEDPFSRDIHLKMQTYGDSFRFGVPDKLTFCGDTLSEQAFKESISAMETLGGKLVIIDYAPLAAAACMLYEDAFVAERYSAIRDFFDSNEKAIIEPVRSIIAKGKGYSAADLYDAQRRLKVLADQVLPMWSDIDLLVVPTAPTHYKIADMLADPVSHNRNLGAYTNFVNLLDYAAISVPSLIRKDGLPFGITLIGQCGTDFSLAELGQRFHHSRGDLNAGATGVPLGEPGIILSSFVKRDSISLAVVGAHLEGMPLHHQLVSRNARLIRKCKTSAHYKLYAIANSIPPKPALVHVGAGGNAIDIEVYELSFAAAGSFLTEIPAPLGLGTLDVEDGSTVKGFIAEPRAMEGADDVSSYGGWRAYINRPK